MSNKNNLVRKIMYILGIPFMLLWTIITGDGGNAALLLNDVTKEDNHVSQQDINNMIR